MKRLLILLSLVLPLAACFAASRPTLDQVMATAQPITASSLPAHGSFWSFQRYSKYPPSPVNWLSGRTDISYYSAPLLGPNAIMIDDRAVDYDQYSSDSQTVSEMSAMMSGPAPSGGFTPFVTYGPNDLWLEIQTDTNETGYVDLFLHGTTNAPPGGFYEVFYKPDLNPPLGLANWIPYEIQPDYDGTNTLLFDFVPIDQPTKFFRAVAGDTVASISLDRENSIAVAPCTNGDPSMVGVFDINISPSVPYDLTVRFTMSGSAINGVDFTNIPNFVTIPAYSSQAIVPIQPTYSPTVDWDKNLTLTLLLTNGCLIDPANASATMTVRECHNFFEIVGTNVPSPSGIDYHPPTQKLLIGVNLYSATGAGTPFDFNIYGTNHVLTNWSGISGITDERKPLVIQSTAFGFTNGDVFFNVGDYSNPGVIGWASADGMLSNLTWCVLTNEPDLVDGSLWVDQTGIWSNNLLAVTAGVSGLTRGVWRIPSPTNSIQITRISAEHLEGLLTLPNDSRYGPWAGKLITADEQAGDVYAVDMNGNVTAFYFPALQADKLLIIPTNQPLYCLDFQDDHPDDSWILKMPAFAFTNNVGDILAEQSGESRLSGVTKIAMIHWNASRNQFETKSVDLPAEYGGHFEGVSFAPIDISPVSP